MYMFDSELCYLYITTWLHIFLLTSAKQFAFDLNDTLHDSSVTSQSQYILLEITSHYYLKLHVP